MDKTIKKIELHDKHNYDLDYWLSKTPEERLSAIEFLRQQYFMMINEPEQRLQRVFRIIKLKQS